MFHISKESTLEDFIKTYVQNKAKSSDAESYADWLKKNGVSSGKIYTEALRDIKTDYELAKSEHGSRAENLGKLGLTASGYSDYLKGKAYSEMQRRKSSAKNTFVENEAKNISGYEEYLKSYTESENDIFNSVISEIDDADIMDYDKAYEYAVGKGLNENDAAFAAKTASDIVYERVRSDVLDVIISNGFRSKQARAYALSVGLSEEDAESLADYADQINRTSYYTQDYLEYLKEKGSQSD